MDYLILKGDCIAIMATMDEASVDSVVCDPPYGIRAMGMAWDGADIEKRASSRREAGKLDPTATHYGAHGSIAAAAGTYDSTLKGNRAFQEWCEEWSTEAFRVLKPGGHMLTCGSPRTHHRLIAGIEDAGFEIRDCLMWLYGQGFPKSHNVAKAIDKMAGAEREVVGVNPNVGNRASKQDGGSDYGGFTQANAVVTAAATEEAKEWEGWGTALKPAWEPIVMARKPLGQTVARSVLEHGTGALNIDATRIGSDGGTTRSGQADYPTNGNGSEDRSQHWARVGHSVVPLATGRWPANLVLDEEAAAALGDNARFFYVAKASRAERNEGLHSPTAPKGKICECQEDENTQKEPSLVKATDAATEKGDSGSITTGSGSTTTDPSLMDSKSTTSIETRLTTDSTISNCSLTPITSERTQTTSGEQTIRQDGSETAQCAMDGSSQPTNTSTSAKRDGHSTENAGHATSDESLRTNASGVSELCPRCKGVVKGEQMVNAHP